jgi:DNA-binding response OmpR family regulator
MRLHALVVNPALTGLDSIEWTARALPGPALLVCGPPAPVADRVRALRAGADDWITKPCHPEELVARIEAVLRRRRAGQLPVEDAALYAGELSIRPDRFDAYADGRPASLSRREYELLFQLARAAPNPSRLGSRTSARPPAPRRRVGPAPSAWADNATPAVPLHGDEP